MSSIAARAELLIRKPPQDVYNAFVDPTIIEKFWLKHTSGPLVQGANVAWEFMVEGARETVTVTQLMPNQVIAFTWSSGIAVTFQFHALDTNTRISVSATGFKGSDTAAQVVDATEGFTLVLCDLKSLLETGASGNMVRDKAALISADRAAPTTP